MFFKGLSLTHPRKNRLPKKSALVSADIPVFAFCLAIFLCLATRPLPAQENATFAEVELHYMDYDPKTPWREDLRTERRPAVYLGEGRFVFFFRKPAEWLRSVSLLRPGLGEVVANYVDHDALLGLVLAHVDKEGQRRLEQSGIRPASFSRRALGDYPRTSFFVSYPGENAGGIAQSSGRIAIRRGFIPWISFHTVVRNLPEGALLWERKKVIGFASYFEKKNRGFLVTPTSLLFDFIKRAGKKKLPPVFRWPLRYQSGLRTGLSLPGFRYHAIVGKEARSFYGLKETENAVLVDSVSPFLENRTQLRKGDLILAVDGKSLSEDGSLKDPLLGNLPLASYLAFPKGRPALPGQAYSLLVQRAHLRKKIMHRLLPLENRGFLVPDYLRRPSFLIVGGLVLQELSGHYLASLPSPPKDLVNLYKKRKVLDPRGLRRIVLIDRILPLKINAGYSARQVRLLSVDGVVVRDLAHGRRLIARVLADGRQLVFGLSEGRRLFFSPSDLPQANRKLQKEYGIPFLERGFAD